MILIEEINNETLRGLSDQELRDLRFRCISLFSSKQLAQSSASMLLDRYSLLRKALTARGVAFQSNAIDDALQKRALVGIDVAKLGDLVLVENYASIGGSFVESPQQAADLDVIIRDRDENRDESVELKLGRALREQTGKEAHFVYAPRGPHSTYIPVFDLVLRARPDTKRVQVRERAVHKGEDAYFSRLDNWDEHLLHDNLEVVRELAPGSVLDLGCGTGRLLKLLEQSGRDVAGVDLSDTALGWCKRRGLRVEKVDLEKGLLPFEDGAFDNVVAVHAAEHVQNMAGMLSEAMRVARKRVALLVPLGERLDPTHRHKFSKLEDLKAALGAGWTLREFDSTAVATRDAVAKAQALRPLQRFVPLKMGRGYAMGEHFDIEEMWHKWAAAYVEKGINLSVQKKYGGWRTVLQLDEKGGTLIYFEDSKKDRSRQFPDLAKELRTVDKPVILDAEIEAITPAGKPIPRKDMAYWGDNPTVERQFTTPGGVKGIYQVHAFDVLYYDGEDLHEKPYAERRDQLRKLFGAFDFKIMKLVPETIVSNKAGFVAAVEKAAKLPGSEGAVVKTVTGDYPLTGQSPTWAKIKTVVEFKVQVLERIPVRGAADTFNYRVAYLSDGELKELGKTYNVKLRANEGQVLTITAQEIVPKVKDGRLEIGAVVPGVQDIDLDRKKPETAEEIAARAWKAGILQLTPQVERQLREMRVLKAAREGGVGQFGNIDFAASTKGTGVAQIHIVGLAEEDVPPLKQATAKLLLARRDPRRLEAALKQAVGEQGAHIDLRLRPEGKDYWEGGEIMLGNISGLSKLAELGAGRKLRFGWKQSRAEEERTEVVRGPLSWMEAGMRKVEVFAPGEVGATANTHGALLNVDKFKWELYLADEHAKKLRVEGGMLLSGNYLFAFVPVGGGERVWMMSKLADDDHEKKIEKKLTAANQKELEAENERIKENSEKPEAKEPHRFRMAQFTHANGHPRCIVCGDEEPVGGVCKMPTAWYGKHAWDDEAAWEAERGRLRAEGVIKGAELFFKFLKMNKRQQVVGGIIYEPDVKDSQGDYADAAEIEKAMYGFMVKYADDTRRFRVNHMGKRLLLPVLECFQPEQDTRKAGHTVKAGSWWLMLKVPDKDLWKDIEEGRLTGFSMGGSAERPR